MAGPVRAWIFTAACLAAASGRGGAAERAKTSFYRYEIEVRTGDTDYASEIPADAPPTGPRYKVERDEQGRLWRVTKLRGDKEISSAHYRYAGKERLPDHYEDFTNGEPTGSVSLRRDSSGARVREEYRTTQGALTSYVTYTWKSNSADAVTFDAEGKKTGHNAYYYSPAGRMVRRIKFPAEGARLDVEIDERTGLSSSAKQYARDQLNSTQKFTYDGSGDLIRLDVYNSDGTWYAAQEYADGLRSKRIYKEGDGAQAVTREFRYAYDEKRWLKSAGLYIQDKFICTLTYDLAPDGTVKRTVATGPDGSLWAEYPAPAVLDIDSNGQPVTRSDGVIHKTGNWW